MADRTLDNRVGKILAKLNGDNISFWKNQWDTHVTYSEDRFDEFGYFSLALKLKKNVDILGYLMTKESSHFPRYYIEAVRSVK